MAESKSVAFETVSGLYSEFRVIELHLGSTPFETQCPNVSEKTARELLQKKLSACP